MKTTMKWASIILVTAMTAASCQKGNLSWNEPQVINSDELVQIQFRSNISSPAVAKRAVAGAVWETNDVIGIFMVKNGSTDVVGSAANIAYKTATGGATGSFEANDPDETLYYPADGSAVNFIAYYPYSSSITALTYAYAVDVSDQSDQEDIDLLYATNTNANSKATAGAVNLQFAHQLAKLALTVKKGENMNDLSGLTVSIEGMNTTADFDLEDGSLDNEDDEVDITPLEVTTPTGSGNDGVYEAILLPVAALDGSHVIKFTLAGVDYDWNLSADITALEAGKKYSYEVTIGAKEVTITGTIIDWDDNTGSTVLY